ncbi:hypothetical protein C8J57DRAFT_1210852 [Mycena rebaudengoi]|nr:hypothetical protein C8J57DRAFT_1210852 [Mycena rebaudengoi]
MTFPPATSATIDAGVESRGCGRWRCTPFCNSGVRSFRSLVRNAFNWTLFNPSTQKDATKPRKKEDKDSRGRTVGKSCRNLVYDLMVGRASGMGEGGVGEKGVGWGGLPLVPQERKGCLEIQFPLAIPPVRYVCSLLAPTGRYRPMGPPQKIESRPGLQHLCGRRSGRDKGLAKTRRTVALLVAEMKDSAAEGEPGTGYLRRK